MTFQTKHINMKKILLYLFLLNSGIFAQLPNTDIWLLDIKAEKDTIILSNPVNITNRVGYDNQPAFSPDGKYLLYTSIRDEKQSDIYKYDLKSKKISQFINTPTTSEYSPTFMPDGKNISVVMVEPDSAQRLWKFPLKGGAPSLAVPQVDSVGYHCWVSNSFVYLFLITDPFKLVLMDLGKDMSYPIIDSAGRSLQISETPTGQRIFFVHKGQIWSSNCRNNSDTRPETSIKFDTEDFAFLKPGQLIVGNDSRLYTKKNFNLDGKEKWVELIDLSEKKIKKITRIAVSKDGKKLAFVAE
jgi:WD40 repeat protein